MSNTITGVRVHQPGGTWRDYPNGVQFGQTQIGALAVADANDVTIALFRGGRYDYAELLFGDDGSDDPAHVD